MASADPCDSGIIRTRPNYVFKSKMLASSYCHPVKFCGNSPNNRDQNAGIILLPDRRPQLVDDDEKIPHRRVPRSDQILASYCYRSTLTAKIQRRRSIAGTILPFPAIKSYGKSPMEIKIKCWHHTATSIKSYGKSPMEIKSKCWHHTATSIKSYGKSPMEIKTKRWHRTATTRSNPTARILRRRSNQVLASHHTATNQRAGTLLP